MVGCLLVKMVWRGTLRQDAKVPRRQEEKAIRDLSLNCSVPDQIKFSFLVKVSQGWGHIRVHPRSSAVSTALRPSSASWRLGVLALIGSLNTAPPRGVRDV